MRAIPVDPAVTRFIVVDVQPAREFNGAGEGPGEQKAHPDGRPLWNVNALAKVAGVEGGEMVRIRIPSSAEPTLEEFAQVSFQRLVAKPWQQGERSGVSFMADGIAAASGNGQRPGKSPAPAEG